MKEIYRSIYTIITFDEERSLMELAYLPETTNMTEDEYKADVTSYFEMVATYKPRLMLSNLKQMYFAISPDLQDWLNATLIPTMPQIPNSRSALVMPDDLYAQISLAQTVEDSLKITQPTESEIQTNLRYFGNRDEAMEWLLE